MALGELLVHIEDHDPAWLLQGITTEEAAKMTGVPPQTLITMRSRGGGPKFVRPKGTRIVRYLRLHLIEWMLSGGELRHTNMNSGR